MIRSLVALIIMTGYPGAASRTAFKEAYCPSAFTDRDIKSRNRRRTRWIKL
jgi:hypothetical protein